MYSYFSSSHTNLGKVQDLGLLVDATVDELGIHTLRGQHLLPGLGGSERIGLGRGRGRLLRIGDTLGRAGLELRKRQSEGECKMR